MSYAWLPVDVGIVGNHKTKRLVRRLKLRSPSEAVGLLACLWCWAMVNAPDGDLTHLDAEDIAGAAEWTDDPETFVKAMHDSKWLDKTPAGYVIHEWEEHQGQSFRKRVWEADRKRMQRDKRGTEVGQERDASGMVDTDQTRQDKTRPKEEEEAPLLRFALSELPPSESTPEDYARTLKRHEGRLASDQIERVICELAEFKPKKPRPKLHLTLNAWLAREKPSTNGNDPLGFITGVQKPDWWVDA